MFALIKNLSWTFLSCTLGAQVLYQPSGFNFGPYIDGQSPDARTPISITQLRARMGIICPTYTKWVKTYGTDDGLQYAGQVAHEKGCKIAMGAWISKDLAANEVQLTNLINAALAGQVDLAVVGHEVMLRRDITESQLIDYINRFRNAVPAVPVSTGDTYFELINRPQLRTAVTLLLPHYYPFWEGYSIDNALGVINQWHQQLTAVAGGKTLIVGETGWLSSGKPVGNAIPSPQNAAAFFLGFTSWARSKNIEYFYFEATDESWKSDGAYWGVWDKNGVLKAGMQQVFDGVIAPDTWSGNDKIGGPGTPSIEFTYVPAVGSTALVAGQVKHVAPSQTHIALIDEVSQSWFWSKPYDFAPSSPILSDGTFQIQYVSGGSDASSIRLLAFLIPATYSPPVLLGASAIPAGLTNNALASVSAVRTPSSITGTVVDAFGAGLGGVTVSYTGPVSGSVVTNLSGQYSIANAPQGVYSVTPVRTGFSFQPAVDSFSVSGPTVRNFTGIGQTATPSFLLSAAVASANAGSNGTSTVTITPVNGFNSGVTLAASSWPAGITGTFGTNPAFSSSAVAISVGSNVAAGSYTLTVTGASGTLTINTAISLTVNIAAGGLPGGVSVNPAASTAAPGVPQNLRFDWASPAGQPALFYGSLLIQDSAFSTPTVSNGCFLHVVVSGAAQLADDAGSFASTMNTWIGNGWTTSPANSHCKLSGPASSLITLTNGGNNLQSTLNLQFNPAWAGKTLRIWMQATNVNYISGPWQEFGSFTVQ